MRCFAPEVSAGRTIRQEMGFSQLRGHETSSQDGLGETWRKERSPLVLELNLAKEKSTHQLRHRVVLLPTLRKSTLAYGSQGQAPPVNAIRNPENRRSLRRNSIRPADQDYQRSQSYRDFSTLKWEGTRFAL
jgi:hypothetical protein